jgi:integrase
VTLPDGLGGRRDVYLGKHDTDESWDEYNRVLAEWKANARRLPAEVVKTSELSVNELILAYWRFAEAYYVKDGGATSEQDVIRFALRFVKARYGDTPARDFGPTALKTVRQAMIDHPVTRKVKVKDPATGKARVEVKVIRRGLARKTVNKLIQRAKRLFAWGVEEELLPATVHLALTRVGGLRRGKSGARETSRVKPVPEAHVEAVLPHVPAAVRTMIEMQRLCGGRPQDVVQVRAIDIDMTGPVWEYRPQRYKTEHRNDADGKDRERVVFLGPKAQALLKPYLTLNVTEYLFSPQRSEAERNARRREQRKTPAWPSHMRRRAKGRVLGDRYTVAAYRRAIARACLKAGVPVWWPNQLRHACGTEVRKRYNLEASQAVLGHAELGVTQVYAEVDREAARRVMAEIG